jgi:hypothetical protein
MLPAKRRSPAFLQPDRQVRRSACDRPELGADALATGHYIRSRPTRRPAIPGRRALFRPADADRDQSYFLFATTQEQIDYLRFPLGNLPKAETRALAEEMGLVVAKKADSQDICFVPQGKYADIINKLKPNAALAGEIVHLDGRVLGSHDGILHYTIGQRRGIGVATGEPLYVVYLDARSRRVIVGPKEALETHRVYLRDVNWLGDGDIGGCWRLRALPVSPRSAPPASPRLRSCAPMQAASMSIWKARRALRPARPARSIPAPAKTPASMAAASSCAPNVRRQPKRRSRICCRAWLRPD